MDHPIRTLLYELFVQPCLRYVPRHVLRFVPWLASDDAASTDLLPTARVSAPSSSLTLAREKAEKHAL